MILSIITINLNNAVGLRRTINSIASQTFSDFEHIIIDGGSIDQSIEVISEFEQNIDLWISEADKGIYNAMNKGIEKAVGNYCLFINSGDRLLENDTLNKIIDNLDDTDILYGDVYLEYAQNKTLKPNIYPDELTFSQMFSGYLCHASTFIKRSLFAKIGPYNEELTIAADWEFIMKAVYLENCSTKHISQFISVYNNDGISSNPKFLKMHFEERQKTLIRYFPLFISDYNKLLALENSTLIFSKNKFIVKLANRINRFLEFTRKHK